jgi:5-methyltetrahydrofolate--homocysteine methyltransferase
MMTTYTQHQMLAPSPLMEALKHHTLLCDGAMGSQVQAMDLRVEEDFLNCENCTEILNESRPDVVKAIHTSYLEAGADCIQTNSFGSSSITLGEFGLEAKAFELSKKAAELARDATLPFVQADGKPRYVLGSIGPGTKLPSLGHVGYDELLASIQVQAEGLLAGGVDAFLIETCQDPLQIKVAIEACKRARSLPHPNPLPKGEGVRENITPTLSLGEREAIQNTQALEPSPLGRGQGEGYIPIFVQVTVETTGSLLVGTDIQGIMGVLSSMGVDALGMNCATGPKEMEPHLEQLAESWPGLIFVQPNAGLPCLKHGKTHYDLTPEQLATALNGFIDKMQLNMVGGCCGTTPEHIRALRNMLDGRITLPHPIKEQASLDQRIPHPNPLPKGEGVGEKTSLTPTLSLREREQTQEVGEVDKGALEPSPLGRGQGEGFKQPELEPAIKRRLNEAYRKRIAEFRQNQTDAEALLWSLLRNNQLLDVKFRRQHPFPPYIADFYCNEAKLIVELDGTQHETEKAKNYDENRTSVLREKGITVLRFTNTQALHQTENVVEQIYTFVEQSLTKRNAHSSEQEAVMGMASHLSIPHPNPLPKGEGVKPHYPTIQKRQVQPEPKVASLYSAVTLRQENAFFAIGERCNANGSKAFREAQAAQDWDSCIAMAQEQEREGSHALDVCTAFVGRNEIADMTAFLERLRGSVSIPLVIDSTELPVIEVSLALYGGKAIVNSINFEDGEAPTHARMKLVSQHGASVIALTIDEAGMAKTVEDKIRITKRLIDFCQTHYGTPMHDILIDPLTFTICTGNEDDRKLGLWTLEAMAEISRLYPEVQIVLGLSNISFGLKPPARRVLNSVYLNEAVKHGMTGAIVHVSKIMPMHQIDPAQRQAALNLIYDNRKAGDPLQEFMALFTGIEASTTKKDPLAHLPEPIEERLKQRIIDGVKIQLNDDLATAMKTYAPLDIINTLLLEGMKVVGELFGSGQMQLPFVLQSAETMKAAVAYLEPFMEKVEGQTRGTVILATVKGDVHDIGKNLVDIILTNNGYTVHNLGIKQHLDDILKAVETHKPDAVGLSGLLVKSTVIMRENMIAMQERGLTLPVFLGGAALTREYVEVECYDAYPHVAYVKDAFESLDLVAKIMAGEFDGYTAQRRAGYREEDAHGEASIQTDDSKTLQGETLNITVSPAEVAQPPLDASLYLERTGGRIETPTVEQLLPYVNLFNVFTRNWGFHPPEADETEAQWRTRLNLDGILHETLNHPEVKQALAPKAVWGIANAKAVVKENTPPCVTLYTSPMQAGEFDVWQTPVAPVWGSETPMSLVQGISTTGDAIGLMAVTLGDDIATLARAWFDEDRYQQYLYLHGILGDLAQAILYWLRDEVIQPYGKEKAGVLMGAGMAQLPDLASQREMLKALHAERLGLEFLDEGLTLSHENAATGFLLWNDTLKCLGW